MPPWWGKSSSKDAKKTTKENLIDTFHRLISPNEQKGSTKSKRSCRRGNDTTVEKGCRSTTVSRPTSPSKEVSRCQSFSADRPHAQPLPIPGLRPAVTRTVSDVTESKPILEKRGKPPLFLPLPKPNRPQKSPGNSDLVSEIVIASVSSNCSADSDDHGDSQLPSPVGNDAENLTNVTSKSKSRSNVRKVRPGAITAKNMKETLKPANQFLSNHILSTSPRGIAADNYQSNLQNPRPVVFESAPNSLMSSPSRSPRRICPDHIPTSAFWAVKPHTDLTFLGSGQCSPGSGQTSGHNSVGGDMLAQLFWQPSRGSPECSPIPSPRMTSPGPSSRVHSGSVSPLHPRSGGMAPESPTSRHDDGKKKQTHKLPLPPVSIPSSSFLPNNSTPTSPISIPRSPGRAENPPSPGSRWKKGKLIGRGTFGHVYVGFNSDSGEMCAMKEVTLFLDDPKSKESAKQLGQEISLLSRLQHPNIVQYYGSETVDDKLYIYLEYVSGGSIHKLLQEYGQLGEPAIRSYTQQILSGLAYLHAKNTVHRDIKGANILVDPSGRVKLADFGMAKHINGQQCPFSFKGSPYWMAPEVLLPSSNGCNLVVDIWSLGCTVLEMATSKPPWSQYEGIAAMFKIGNSKELPQIPDHLSEQGKDFIRKCLQRDPSQRPTAVELLQHPFIQNGVSLEKSVLSDPLEHLAVISCRPNSKVAGHTRNISSLGLEGQTIYQRRGAKFSSKQSDIHIRSNISCPVSPCGSPQLKSRSPRHTNGRMSPSPISSPRTTSGASTPLSCGNGAIPFNHLKQPTHSNEGFVITSRGPDNFFPSRPTDPIHGQFVRVHQVSQGVQERVVSEADILSPQFGKRLGNVFDLRDRLPPSEHFTHRAFVDHVKLNPSLDLTSGSPHLGLKHGN